MESDQQDLLRQCPGECGKTFTTTKGLMKHLKKCSSANPDDKPKQTCVICGKKDLVFIESHMRQVHGMGLRISKKCPVCKKTIEGDNKLFNQHKKECRKCPFCGYENAQNKLDRLLKHIERCPKREQEIALDLRSPAKEPADIPEASGGHKDHPGPESKESGFINSPEVSSDSLALLREGSVKQVPLLAELPSTENASVEYEGQEERERITVCPRREATFGLGDGMKPKVGSGGHEEQDRVQAGLGVGQAIASKVIFFLICIT